MPDILLRGGRVIDPARNLDAQADLLVQDGKIARVEPGLAAPAAEGPAENRNKGLPGYRFGPSVPDERCVVSSGGSKSTGRVRSLQDSALLTAPGDPVNDARPGKARLAYERPEQP